jgi:F-type H+-transporting ATPase subunit epsilon
MGSIHLSVVRPDRLVWEGDVHHLILSTVRGEMGIWPLHAPEIVALGSGVMRVHREAEGGPSAKVIVAGGYVEVSNDNVIVLADHARRTDDVDPSVVKLTRKQAAERRDTLPEGEEHRAAYYDNKIAWCDLLLKYGEY